MTSCGYDVAIIGLGPVGAVAAALFGKAGLRVLVADKVHDIHNKPRAVALDHEIMRILQELGLADEVEPFTAPFTLSEHYGAEGQLIRRVGMLPPPYPMGWTPSMAFLQPHLERVIRHSVSGLNAVDVRLGLELLALDQDAQEVALTFRDENGVIEQHLARYVIGCDGASSSVRGLVGIELEDLDFDEPWLVIDLLVNESGARKLPQVSTHFCDPKRPAMFVVCTGNHRRVEIMLLPGETSREMEDEACVWRLLSRWIDPADATLWRRSSYRFHALIARDWRVGRVFLAGDAAHQQPPFLGQGMCQGVRDVYNLSWKLRTVLAREACDDLLDTYAVERGAHVRELTATIKQIGRTLCELDPVKARERDARTLAEAGGTVPTLLRQQLMPPLRDGLLSTERTSARGTLFPQPMVLLDEATVLLDDAAGVGWRVVLGPGALDWPVDALAMPVLRIAITPHPGMPQPGIWQEVDGVVAEWMARHDCKAAVVRPDHYVFASADDPGQLRAELAGLAAMLRPNSLPVSAKAVADSRTGAS